MGGTFRGTPAASAKHAERIDVFAITTEGELRRRWWDGRMWVPWATVPSAPDGAVDVACSWIGERLDVFVRIGSAELWYADLAAVPEAAPR